MDSDDKKMEDELRSAVAEAFKKIIQSLEQEPAVILESEDTGDIPDSLAEEIEAWLFGRRTADGNTDNRTDK